MGSQLPFIRIAELENNKYSSCIIKRLNDSYHHKLKHLMDTTCNCTCYVGDFDIPSSILSEEDTLFNNRSYDILFSVGTGAFYEDVFGYIIEPQNIGSDITVNAYYWILPSISTRMHYASSVYSSKYGLIAVADDNFCILKFSEKETENTFYWKWHEYKTNTKRECPAITMISDDKLFCCGDQVDQTEFYDFNNKKWIKLADMKHERQNAAICFDEFTAKRVYVGGGEDAEHTFEYFDITKNDWYSLSETKGDHHRHPIMWMDNKNIINIGSTYCGLFERLDLRENVWNIYKKHDDKSLDNLFGVEIETEDETTRFII